MTIYSSPLQIPSLLRCREPSSIPITRTLFRRNTCRPSSLGFPSLKTLKCLSQRQSQGPTQEFERLFSNLNQATLKREPGSLTSAILLVAGTTVGAGILAIPAVTEEAGFLASAVTCILCWIYMVVTGLLIAEVNVNTMCELGSGGVSLLLESHRRITTWRLYLHLKTPTASLEIKTIRGSRRSTSTFTDFIRDIDSVSMAMRTLGKVGVQIACWSYLFIHYALLVAYVARSSDILTNFFHIPLWEAAALFSLVFGAICYFGSQRFIGAINGLLVFGIIVSFTALVGLASGDLEWNSLLQAHFEAIPQSIPIIALAFVYQNVVPVLCTNLEGNLSKVRTAVVLGTAVPLALFLIWDAVILGTISNLDISRNQITDPLQLLRSTSGIVGPVIDVFSFLAIATSYIGFVLGLSDFLSDLLKLPSGASKPIPYLLTVLPPLMLSLLDPDIFFKALDFAGTYGVLVLFGILPAAMSWSERYQNASQSPKLPSLIPGGRFTLSLVIGGAAVVILSEVFEKISIP